MPMETYTLELSEPEGGEELRIEVYTDGVIAASERVEYADYALTAAGEEPPEPHSREVTADVTALDVQVTRLEDAFEVRLFGDREPLLVERIADDDWGLVAT